jgi:hypothetical protein
MGGLAQQDVDFDQAATTATSICITRHDGPIPGWYRDFLRESLGRKQRGGGLPILYVNEGTRGPRPPETGEVRLLADALDAIAALVDRDALNPPVFEPGSPMPCVRLRSGGGFEITETTPEFRPPQVERYRAQPDRRDAIRKLPQLGCTDFVSCSVAPALVQGRKVRMLTVAQADRDLVLAGECMELEDQEGMARRLFAVYEGHNTDRRIGLPREIQTDSRYFYEAFKDVLGEIGIRVICFEHIPALERLRQSFADYLDSMGETGGAGQK